MGPSIFEHENMRGKVSKNGERPGDVGFCTGSRKPYAAMRYGLRVNGCGFYETGRKAATEGLGAIFAL